MQPLDAEQYFPTSTNSKDARKEEWVTGGNEEPQVGLALAGGGTRAAQFAVGVLKGLNDSGVLKEVDIISSVSGGGYAAYGYFSHLLNNANLPTSGRLTQTETEQRDLAEELRQSFFADCVPSRYKSVLNKLAPQTRQSLLCPPDNKTNVIVRNDDKHEYEDPYRSQNNLRSHIDLFEPEFDYEPTTDDTRFKWRAFSIGVRQVLLTLATEPLTDFVFDWNTPNNFPGFSSRLSYREGIQRVWGLPPVNCGTRMNDKKGTEKRKSECWAKRPLADEINEPKPKHIMLTFQQLRDAYRKLDNHVPFWIINATTPVLDCDGTWYTDPSCTMSQSWKTETYPPHRAGFEITPYRWGSGEHGYWPSEPPSSADNGAPDNHGLRVDEAVSAAAAFFDPYEKTLSWWGIARVALANGFQKASGFKWGYYIANPVIQTEAPWQRYFHRILPFPLYLLHGWQEKKHAMDVHLIDGGQHENLGAVALIRRRIPNIIIADHASDGSGNDWGKMADICNLRSWLDRSTFAEKNGGKIWHIHIDDLEPLDEVCSGTLRYNLYAWKNSVIMGCAVELNKEDLEGISQSRCDGLRKRFGYEGAGHLRTFLNLYLIKPAINLSEWTEKLRQINERLDGKAPSFIPDDRILASDAEILGFLIKNADQKGIGWFGASDEGILFPRHDTVRLTIDSSPWLFGAYRELGARSARKLRYRKREDRDDVLEIDGVTERITQPLATTEQVIQSMEHLSKEFRVERDRFLRK